MESDDEWMGFKKSSHRQKSLYNEDPNHFFRRYPSDDDALDKTDSRRWKAFVRKSRSFKTGKNDFFRVQS